MSLTTLFAVKGGQGTTVTAAALAVISARHRRTALVTHQFGDARGALGVLDNEDGIVAISEGLTLYSEQAAEEMSILDRAADGVLDVIHDATGPADTGRNLLVIRPCFMALQRALNADLNSVDGIVLVEEDGRALTEREIEDVLGVTDIVRVPVEPAIARAVDAGLLTARVPKLLERHLARLVAVPA